MRLLLTTDTVGGVWTFTRELTIGLLQRGHSVALVSLGRQPSNAQRSWSAQVNQSYPAKFRFETSDAPLEWMKGNAFAYSLAEALLLRIIREFRVNVVHSNQLCFGALPVDIPKIVTAHSDVLTWAHVCKSEPLAHSDWLRDYCALVSRGLAGADAVVAPTWWMRDALVSRYSTATAVRVILNGRTLEPLTADGPRLLQAVTVGRLWDEAKGLAVLNEVSASMPVLVIGETCFAGEYAPKLTVGECVGRLEEDDLLAVFRSSSLYLVTSIYEPFGLAPLEAALCGCGIVARSIPSLREVWGGAAEYFADSVELSALLLRLQESPAELRALQDRSFRRASELSASRMIDSYEAAYSELLTTRSACEAYALYAG